MNMNMTERRRGLVNGAAMAEARGDAAAVLGELKGAFRDFRARNEDRVAALEREVDNLQAFAGAARVGPGGGSPLDEGGISAALRASNAAMAAFVRTGNIPAPRATMSSDSAPDGGYLVEPEMADQIRNITPDVSPIARLARRIPLTRGDAFEEPLSIDQPDAAWAGESQARPEGGTPTLRMFSVTLHESFVNQPATQRIIDDAKFDVAGWLTGKILQKFNGLDGAAFVGGDGINKPRGITAYPVSTDADDVREWGTIQVIDTGASGDFAATDPEDALVDTIYALRAPYRAGARWLMSLATAGRIRKLKDADGRSLWRDSLAEGQPPLLLGFPVEFDEQMPPVAADSLSVAFGDFQQGYTVVERPGVRLLRDPFTSKPNVLFYATKRIGGGVANSQAIKLVRFSA